MSLRTGATCLDALKRFGKQLGVALLTLSMTNMAIAGNLLWTENYKPYGEKLTRSPASAGNTIGFHGKAHDDGSGLSYMGARYCDPALGRFIGVDPVGFQEDNLHSVNRYTYTNNNPYKYIDPDGNYAFLIQPMIYLVTALVAAVTINTAMKGVAQPGASDKKQTHPSVPNKVPLGQTKAHLTVTSGRANAKTAKRLTGAVLARMGVVKSIMITVTVIT